MAQFVERSARRTQKNSCFLTSTGMGRFTQAKAILVVVILWSVALLGGLLLVRTVYAPQ
jgi:hypothetical protein